MMAYSREFETGPAKLLENLRDTPMAGSPHLYNSITEGGAKKKVLNAKGDKGTEGDKGTSWISARRSAPSALTPRTARAKRFTLRRSVNDPSGHETAVAHDKMGRAAVPTRARSRSTAA